MKPLSMKRQLYVNQCHY